MRDFVPSIRVTIYIKNTHICTYIRVCTRLMIANFLCKPTEENAVQASPASPCPKLRTVWSLTRTLTTNTAIPPASCADLGTGLWAMTWSLASITRRFHRLNQNYQHYYCVRFSSKTSCDLPYWILKTFLESNIWRTISSKLGFAFCRFLQSCLLQAPSCVDINECQDGSAACIPASTECINLPGGYKCQCLSGYEAQMC